MAKTVQLELPLLLPAQAQKHVTVNEALIRLDAAAQLTIMSDQVAPPLSAADGACYLVPEGAAGAWFGKGGEIAVRCNGGWVFLRPRIGWRGWDQSLAATRMFDGVDWVADAVAISGNGAATMQSIIEFDHEIAPGIENLTEAFIPRGSQILGVTGRVISAVSGFGVTAWSLGVAGSVDRFGHGIGKDVGASVLGLPGTPVTHYADTPLLISAEGGSFSGGVVRLALHLLRLAPPRL